MKLIMKADDFGATIGVTDGIAETIQKGIVTDTSFLTNTKHYNYAINKANEIGLKKCGLHLTLTFGYPLCSKEDIPSIVQSSGRFFYRPEDIPKDYDIKHIEMEFRAQLQKFKESGLTLTHLDSHHHVHGLLNDDVVELVMTIAREECVPVRRQLESHIPIMNKYNVKTSDYLDRRFGANNDQSSINHLKNILDEYQSKKDNKNLVLEIMCHPGYVDQELLDISSFTYPREIEVDTLKSEEIKVYIKEKNISLIDFSELK